MVVVDSENEMEHTDTYNAWVIGTDF